MKKFIYLIVIAFLISGCSNNSKEFERLTLFCGDETMECMFGIYSEVSEFELNDIQLKILLANNEEYNPQLNYYAAIIVSNIDGKDISLEEIENKQKCSIIKEYSDFFNNYNKYGLDNSKDNFDKFKYSERICLEQTLFPKDNALIYITFVYVISETIDGYNYIYEDGRISYDVNYEYKGGKLCIR